MVWQSWRSAWHEALYGTAGFYRRPDGPAAHFATSAQGIPGGGRMLASAVALLAEQAGCRHVVDVGAGRGELLRELAEVAPHLGQTGVDVVPRPPSLPAAAGWLTAPGGPRLPDSLRALRDTLVIAHEWLDVVPCTVAEHDGAAWREVEVADDGDERLGDPVNGADLQWLQLNWPTAGVGDRAEVGLARDLAWAELRDRVDSGVLFAVDYGHLCAERPRHGTLTGFRDGAQCLPSPDGHTDITAHVAMDTLGATELVRQRELFDRVGLQPSKPSIRLASQDPPAYLRQLAAVSAYAELTRHGGLGDFWWASTGVEG